MSLTVRFDNGDIEIDSAGNQTLIQGAEKAAQDLLDEVLLPYDATRDRGDQLFNADGSLTNTVNDDVISTTAVKALIQAAVRRLMQAQANDANTDDTEAIQNINTLVVVRNPNDPTAYSFLLAVTVNDQNISIARAIRMGHLGNTPFPLVGGADPT